ncbi:MAG: ABC transporter ATP-binding protein [Deltaproteobacteria bacterium]|jgi:spermidine/putrescine transport system ATP-binding protein|nr:ABC transporter ATP-binding protein [Deltaproteobacteria bacterium]
MATGLSKSFGNHQVLNQVALEVFKGEFFTLLGPSGCGKTTLLRLIAGFDQPDSGTICLGGQDITSLPANKRQVNTVFQSYALFPHLNVAENIAFGLKARKVKPGTVSSKTAEMLKMLSLEGMEKYFPSQLSGGQKQRVALARALVNEPDVLLLDEPMSALDPQLRSQVQAELLDLQNKTATTFIMVTHDQEEAMFMGTRMAVMKDGRLVQIGTPRDVYTQPNSKFVAEFLWGANVLEATWDGKRWKTEVGPLTTGETEPGWKKGHLAVRPELIVLNPSAPETSRETNTFTAKILRSVYRGSSQELTLEPGRVKVVTGPEKKFNTGDYVSLFIPPASLVALKSQAA